KGFPRNRESGPSFRFFPAGAPLAFPLGGQHVGLFGLIAGRGVACFLLDVVVVHVILQALVVPARRRVVALAVFAAGTARGFLLTAARALFVRLLLVSLGRCGRSAAAGRR